MNKLQKIGQKLVSEKYAYIESLDGEVNGMIWKHGVKYKQTLSFQYAILMIEIRLLIINLIRIIMRLK